MKINKVYVLKGSSYKNETLGEQYFTHHPSEKEISIFLESMPSAEYCKVEKIYKKKH